MSDIPLTASFIAFRRHCFARMRAIEHEANELKKGLAVLCQRLDAYENALTKAGESQAIDMWLKSLDFDEDGLLPEEPKENTENEDF